MQMALEEVAEVSYCYYSRDSREIVRKFPCLEAAKFTDHDRTFWDVLPRGPARTFSDVAPGKGLTYLLHHGGQGRPCSDISVCLHSEINVAD